jgi:hypothetical protein
MRRSFGAPRPDAETGRDRQAWWAAPQHPPPGTLQRPRHALDLSKLQSLYLYAPTHIQACEAMTSAGPVARDPRASLQHSRSRERLSVLQGADDDGIVSVTITFVHPRCGARPASLNCAGVDSSLQWTDARTLTGCVRVPHIERWCPHTHWTPKRHAVVLKPGEASIAPYDVGFRSIDVDCGSDREGFALRINDALMFCRGACWTSADLVSLTGAPEQLAHAFALARDAGMNMLRVGGTKVYESDTFRRLADEHGILIWQDFSFANFDYPTDQSFVASVTREIALQDALGTIHTHDPRWKAAVPRAPNAGWDFDDVRDHYLRTLFGVEPARVRYEDPQRYLDLSRAVVVKLMTDVFTG